MNEDSWLLIVVFAIWAVLAVAYATVPMLHMPGYSTVWGWGSVIFLGLGVLIGVARARGRQARER